MWLNRFGVSGGKPSITEIQLLLVGGGGATPTATSGGGGGGGFIETYVYNIRNDWPIIIGNGGINGGSDAYGGYPTSAFGLEAAGGGTGVHWLSSPPRPFVGIGIYGSNSIDGGSGGGGFLNEGLAYSHGPGGLGNTPSYSPVQGYDGGSSNSTGAAGGGGGAGGVGSPNASSTIGGNGGNGRVSTITGSTVYYAPGGGGYGYAGNGTGGLGSYGRGSTWDAGGYGAGGGAGIAIIRYEGSSARATGGSISYISGYVIHTFTANGTFSVI